MAHVMSYSPDYDDGSEIALPLAGVAGECEDATIEGNQEETIMSDHDAPRADTVTQPTPDELESVEYWRNRHHKLAEAYVEKSNLYVGAVETALDFERALTASRERSRQLAAALDDLLDTCDIQMRADGGLIVLRDSMERARELLAAAALDSEDGA